MSEKMNRFLKHGLKKIANKSPLNFFALLMYTLRVSWGALLSVFSLFIPFFMPNPLKRLKWNKMYAKKASGFTLIELLVAVTISGIILTGVMTSYGTFVRNKQKIDVQRMMQTQSTFALSRMADAVRDFGIDYEADNEWNARTLPVGNGNVFLFKDDGLFLNIDGEIQPLISERLTVEGSFAVTPETFDTIKDKLFQPKVHVNLKVSIPAFDGLETELQTTISSRVY